MAGIIFIPRRVFPAGLNISKSRAIGNNRIFHATSALNYRAAFRFYGPRSTLYDQLAPREIQPNYIGGTKGRRGIVVINTLSPNRIYIPSNFLPAWKYLINISDVVYRRAKSQTSRKRRKNSKRKYIYIYTHSAERVSSIAFSVRNRKARLAAVCTGWRDGTKLRSIARSSAIVQSLCHTQPS